MTDGAAASWLRAGTTGPDGPTEADRWAASGAMAITGEPGGACLLPTGCPASVAASAAAAIEDLTGAVVDGPALLGERAAVMGLTAGGRVSAGGGTRLLETIDGWCAVNLARDADLVPALTGSQPHGEVWEHLGRWLRTRSAVEVRERAVLLGMPIGVLGETARVGTPWRMRSRRASTYPTDDPVVVSLGALWAGPLAAGLLSLAGARVIHVESRSRRDPTATDAPAFYELLRRDGEVRAVDFSPADGQLRALLQSATVVVEASRRRALVDLGCDAETVLSDGRSRTWLRITGHRDPRRVAFGDDAAVAGGLVAWSDGRPVFAGDAIADPLTGLMGALAIVGCHRPDRSTVIDVAMADVASYCAHVPGQPPEGPAAAVAAPHVARRRRSPALRWPDPRRPGGRRR